MNYLLVASRDLRVASLAGVLVNTDLASDYRVAQCHDARFLLLSFDSERGLSRVYDIFAATFWDDIDIYDQSVGFSVSDWSLELESGMSFSLPQSCAERLRDAVVSLPVSYKFEGGVLYASLSIRYFFNLFSRVASALADA